MPEAETDLAAIWLYGYANFGLEKTEVYTHKIYLRYNQLSEHELGRRRIDLGERVFALPHREHVIFYRAEPNKVIVLRILHHSQDAIFHITNQQWL
ncbi:type II toxin-antitoxin system RelE/ParE family toxin [Pantoea nemavictus]|uniref:Type II toxin-antitoxin system RelE/ParE family toxin n=1 Tax=Pantoea nemavictus TaxID=2726955 RepID=A0ABU8PS03_9GAMM|nr:type II toxin-antitoxin system RelE/ParE family toxin [Pantoea nemavictus]